VTAAGYCDCSAPKPQLVEGIRLCGNRDCGRQIRDPRDRLLVLIAKQQRQILEEIAKLNQDRGPESEQHIEEQTPTGLDTPAELARRLGWSRKQVYDRQHELGVIRLGGRLYFDPERVDERLASLSNGASSNGAGKSDTKPKPRRRRRSSGAVELLPVRGKAT
jgi:hypothetical protein